MLGTRVNVKVGAKVRVTIVVRVKIAILTGKKNNFNTPSQFSQCNN